VVTAVLAALDRHADNTTASDGARACA